MMQKQTYLVMQFGSLSWYVVKIIPLFCLLYFFKLLLLRRTYWLVWNQFLQLFLPKSFILKPEVPSDINVCIWLFLDVRVLELFKLSHWLQNTFSFNVFDMHDELIESSYIFCFLFFHLIALLLEGFSMLEEFIYRLAAYVVYFSRWRVGYYQLLMRQILIIMP